MPPSSRSWHDRRAIRAIARSPWRPTLAALAHEVLTLQGPTSRHFSCSLQHAIRLPQCNSRFLRILIAILGILRQKALDHGLKGFEGLGKARHRLLAMLVDDRHRIFGREGLRARQHLEHDHSKAVQVTAGIDRLAMTLPPGRSGGGTQD